jgi:ribosomal protein S18 acetylase RimI-like enzyme
MAISNSISRLATYYKRNGFGATLRRAALAVQRALFSNVMVLLYCDLSDGTARPLDSESFVKVEQKRSCAELSRDDLQAMTSFWNPKVANRRINDRFDKGALLWLIRSEGRLAGYGWTMCGSTIEPHYFPLGQRDAHLFDFHVFPKYRGQGINPSLVGHILGKLAAEGSARAFIEAAEWNRAQLASLGKTRFHRLARARKWTVLGHTIVFWVRGETLQQVHSGGRSVSSTLAPSENARSSTSNSRVF